MSFLLFQDVLCAHEKLQNSASSSSSRNLDRVYAEKKLSILDKALKMNPNSEPLCNQRYEIMKQFQPIDKVSIMKTTYNECRSLCFERVIILVCIMEPKLTF